MEAKRKAIINMALYAKTKVSAARGNRLELLLRNMSTRNLLYCVGSMNCSLCQALFPRLEKKRSDICEPCPCDVYSHEYLVKVFRFAKKVIREEGLRL